MIGKAHLPVNHPLYNTLLNFSREIVHTQHTFLCNTIYHNSLLFVVKIFSSRENVRIFFTRILFYNDKFSDEYLGEVHVHTYSSGRSLGWRLLGVTPRHCTAYRASSSQEQGTHFRDLPWQLSNDSFLLQYRYGVPVSHVGRLPATH